MVRTSQRGGGCCWVLNIDTAFRSAPLDLRDDLFAHYNTLFSERSLRPYGGYFSVYSRRIPKNESQRRSFYVVSGDLLVFSHSKGLVPLSLFRAISPDNIPAYFVSIISGHYSWQVRRTRNAFTNLNDGSSSKTLRVR